MTQQNPVTPANEHPTVYPLTVDYDLTIEDLVEQGKYDWADDNITSKNFPSEKKGKADLEGMLVHFDRNISTEAVLAELEKQGLRAANAAEILAFGAKYPEVQRQFPIIALGQSWRRPNGSLNVVCLPWDGGRRSAVLSWVGGGWSGRCRFLAFRKSS